MLALQSSTLVSVEMQKSTAVRGCAGASSPVGPRGVLMLRAFAAVLQICVLVNFYSCACKSQVLSDANVP